MQLGLSSFITLWDAPNGGTVRAQFQNGEQMWVYYIYRDRWALTAWCKLQRLLLIPGAGIFPELDIAAGFAVMWEPNGNYFYDTHRDQCEYENRGYYANGREGFISRNLPGTRHDGVGIGWDRQQQRGQQSQGYGQLFLFFHKGLWHWNAVLVTLVLEAAAVVVEWQCCRAFSEQVMTSA